MHQQTGQKNKNSLEIHFFSCINYLKKLSNIVIIDTLKKSMNNAPTNGITKKATFE